MAVPTRPVAGAPIETAWGSIAHDTAVAQDIQSGTFNAVFSSTAAVAIPITFPRPFATGSVPMFVAMAVWQSVAGMVGPIVSLQGGQMGAAGGTVRVANANSAAAVSGTFAVNWIAIGPRA